MSVMFERQNRFLVDFCMLVMEAQRLGFKVSGGELWRPEEMQALYLKQGKTQVAHSKHQDKLAGDLNFMFGDVFVNGLPALEAIAILAPLGHFWENLRLGNRWGGNFDRDWSKPDNFKDVPHFEAG